MTDHRSARVVADAAAHATALRRWFVDVVLAESPGTVLDVGCGGGGVLLPLAAAGVDVVGVDATADAMAALDGRGIATVVAPAERLPFVAGAFDHVVMRHVPHHLRDERPALVEALRVARSGVVVAEPYFDPELPSQQVACDADELVKALHRRLGRVHRPNLGAAALIRAFGAAALEFTVGVHLPLRDRPFAELTDELAPLLDAVGDAADRAAAERLAARARTDGLTRNGSLVVVARRRAL